MTPSATAFWALFDRVLVPWSVFVPQGLLEVPGAWREFRSQMTRPPTRQFCFFFCGSGDCGLFFFFTRQELLHHPRNSGDGAANRRVAWS